ncbi:MAG: cytochrome c3 family protein [Jaaginema sp. PMC 1079.18]|nr:cytochrome c3 family protein [Jaaginema sp. PMC 1080.18]MEC4849448.1 cytochrome c3 family protein [Jaaginema sp. PMC 1079.18]MEC4865453.1 cytochrome c3 family protein [Jaaginema sp. PMC 1078.18]
MTRQAGQSFVSKIFSLRTAIIGVVILLFVWFGAAFALDQRSIFLPGETSDGHYLFETACSSCHEGFKPVSNETCNRCHEAELAEDAHGAKKFRDPRWAELLTRLDVLTCTACHEEHVHMFGRGVHLQPDLCMACHQGLIEGELASHTGFSPDGCWTAGCHNFHDHRSISTGFIRQHIDEPPMLPEPGLPQRLVEATVETAPKPDLSDEFLEEQS